MDETLPETLSKRGQHTFSQSDPLVKYLSECSRNAFHPVHNPNGVINLGTAVDKMMESELEERLAKDDLFRFKPSHHQHYFDFHGKDDLRKAHADFFNKYFNVAEDISPDNLIVVGGTASCLDSLSFALFDPDEVYITPTPTYARMFVDLHDRSLAQPYALELPEEPNSEGKTFVISAQILEERILQLKGEGKKVKGFLLVNPQNPLGDIYPSHLVLSLLNVCAKYELHVIVDEVYALSLLKPDAEVTSVLSIPNIPDPQRTHFVWAFTKDFGLAGFRVGAIHTKNKALLKVLTDVAIYCPPASIVQDAATTILNDTKWLDEVFFPRRKQRLQNRYQLVKSRLEGMAIPVKEAEGGLFVWFDLRKFLKQNTVEAERELFEELLQSGLYIVPGTFMYCKTPGWFRMIFSVSAAELEKGLERLEKVLSKYKQ